jgi:AraC-like DNA-binding protein
MRKPDNSPREKAGAVSDFLPDTSGQRAGSGYSGAEELMLESFAKLSADEILSISVEEFAGKFQCGPQGLSRLFQRHFGISIGAMKLEIRLLKARSLLRAPGTKVKNVADGLGFNHLGLFNACFEKRFGVNPGKWRKLNGADAPRPQGQEVG